MNHASLWCLCLLVAGGSVGRAEEPADDLAEQRLDVMRQRALSIRFRAAPGDFPERLEQEPLFRYDDPTRGYIDGTVWRLGAEGRPLAIITTELAPRYAGRPCVVYDYLSLSQVPFTAASNDVPGWSPPHSAVELRELPGAPEASATENGRLLQLKQLAGRFSGTQDVEGQLVPLRLLPRPIDRYAPEKNERADGAIFVMANGRMPGVVLLIETDGDSWSYGVGRLSHPCTLRVLLDDKRAWEQPPAELGWNLPYTASSLPAKIPGIDE
jgi:hypothetical protein